MNRLTQKMRLALTALPLKGVKPKRRVTRRPVVSVSGAALAAALCVGYAMGLVIFSGLIVGTCFTLFVVPMFYTFISPRDRAEATAWPELT